MSEVRSLDLSPLSLPPGLDAAKWYSADGAITMDDERRAFYPIVLERLGRSEAELENLAKAYLADRVAEAFPTPPETAPVVPAYIPGVHDIPAAIEEEGEA